MLFFVGRGHESTYYYIQGRQRVNVAVSPARFLRVLAELHYNLGKNQPAGTLFVILNREKGTNCAVLQYVQASSRRDSFTRSCNRLD